MKWFKYVPIQRTRISFYWNNEQRKRKNIIGCIYKHPKLPIEECHYQFFSPILEKVSFENSDNYILGDFNINLLNCESDRYTACFLDDMDSNSCTPYIMLPTRITPRSKILTDNIFYNNFNASMSGNLITDISDHLAQFIITS